MNDNDKIEFMLKSVTDNTISICQQNGMEQSQINEYVSQSQASMYQLMSALYKDMKDNSLIA